MLTQQLRDLEQNGIVTRTVYPQLPPKAEYGLTDLGRALGPVFSCTPGLLRPSERAKGNIAISIDRGLD